MPTNMNLIIPLNKYNLLQIKANSIIVKYKEQADSTNKQAELENQIKKLQDQVEKEKEKSFQEF